MPFTRWQNNKIPENGHRKWDFLDIISSYLINVQVPGFFQAVPCHFAGKTLNPHTLTTVFCSLRWVQQKNTSWLELTLPPSLHMSQLGDAWEGITLFLCTKSTPPKFNMAPEKLWLEDYLPFGKAYFQGLCWISGVYANACLLQEGVFPGEFLYKNIQKGLKNPSHWLVL